MRGSRSSIALASAAIALALAVGCGPPSTNESRIAPPDAVDAVQTVLQIPLSEVEKTDVAALTNLLAAFEGGTPYENALVLVFDSRGATEQLTGARAMRPEDALITWKNVAVLYYRQASAPSRRADLARALKAL